MTSLTILGAIEKLSSFRLVLEGKTGKVISASRKVEFLERFSVDNFALTDAEDNICGPFIRGSVADLSLLRTLIAICQKPWQLMGTLVLLANASWAGSKTLL